MKEEVRHIFEKRFTTLKKSSLNLQEVEFTKIKNFDNRVLLLEIEEKEIEDVISNVGELRVRNQMDSVFTSLKIIGIP